MKTEFMLLAVYDSPMIPLDKFAKDVLGIELRTAYNRISAGTFPVPVLKPAGKPMIDVRDAANYIDSLKQDAA